MGIHHYFADDRIWLGLPHAGDVLSNIAFFAMALVGAWVLARRPAGSIANMERAMAAMFFAGLAITAFCSAWYHLQPDDARLVIDRSGMAIAFAGLLGLAVATHVGCRAGAVTGLALLLASPWAIRMAAHGQLIPWAIIQFGGMAALCVVAWRKPQPRALQVEWLAVVAIYALAKLAEVNDDLVYEFTHHIVSGHTLKHVIAACAAWPLICALRVAGSVQNGERITRRKVPA